MVANPFACPEEAKRFRKICYPAPTSIATKLQNLLVVTNFPKWSCVQPVEWQQRETVATWSIRLFGRVPKRDETLTVGEYQLTIIEANAERPRRVRIERLVINDATAS